MAGGARPDLRWPPVLRRRSGAGALLLGALVGFGSGYYYAGEARRGLLFSVVDGVLVMGAVCTTV
ncbi:MAG: hypothetical protein HY903_02775, partial [Deltaproteobacteria bacterium]|nr:hypothetical protein [Deltaproteobacteria bacterium]